MPVTKEEFEKAGYPLRLKVMNTGGFGTGKTTLAQTFPRWAYAMLEPNGILCVKQNPKLLENMVHYEEFIPSSTEDIRLMFERLVAYTQRCRQEALEGKIQTFILDNATYLSEYRWEYVEKYEKTTSARTGNVDKMGMFGNLGDWMWKFVVKEVISIPCHVVVNFHQQEEGEMDEATGKMKKTGRIISDTMGRFRDRAPGLFNASLFLERQKFGGGWKFIARCIGPEGAGKPAKNNLGLPEVVEDISYEKIMSYLKKGGEK